MKGRKQLRNKAGSSNKKLRVSCALRRKVKERKQILDGCKGNIFAVTALAVHRIH